MQVNAIKQKHFNLGDGSRYRALREHVQFIWFCGRVVLSERDTVSER